MKEEYPVQVKKWDVFEVSVEGPNEGNPFTEQWISGIFTGKNESVVTEGFYDGDGIYRIRFMPSFEGRYTFVLRASFLKDTISGVFYSEQADTDNHGPVRTVNTHHFIYEDGTAYYPIGTTAYAWAVQSQERIQQTLATLDEAPFNKMRFCIFPKHYIYNFSDPSEFPYVGTPMDASILNEENFMTYIGKAEGNDFDYTRFNPVYFQNIERCIEELGKRGIEADLICMHPYDRWGFSCMSREEDDLYWNYIINRFSAYHNVWWSLANEYDLMKEKTIADWEHYADLLVRKDPYHHLRSIHNCRVLYDHSRPWVTHCSVQRVDLYKGAEYTDELCARYGKPVVNDEIAYEGNISLGWGNITAEEMTRRFWETAVRGGYPGHGETYLNDEDVLWWSHGGQLHGESWKRFGFLLDILKEVPGHGIACIPMMWDCVTGVPEEEWHTPVKSQYLFYYSFMRPSFRDFYIDDETDFIAEVIDTWNMTIQKAGIHSGQFRIELPARQYMAIRLRKPNAEDYADPYGQAEIEETDIPVTDETLAVEETVEENPVVTDEPVETTEEPVEDLPVEDEEEEVAFESIFTEKDPVNDDDVLSLLSQVEEETEEDELPEIVTGSISLSQQELSALAQTDISLEDTADLEELDEEIESTLNIPHLRFHHDD